MFYRWIFLNNNPTARRNQQYIFSALHNKDIRAVDSGIYASIHASRMPNMTARKLLDKVETNDKELECNLATTMAAVRNSSEYWSKCSYKLSATNTHCGPGTFFCTVSIAEYNWVPLKVFLQTMNKDIPEVSKMSLNDLCDLDPCSVSLFFDKKFNAFWKTIV
jgi:hypothetical protein